MKRNFRIFSVLLVCMLLSVQATQAQTPAEIAISIAAELILHRQTRQ